MAGVTRSLGLARRNQQLRSLGERVESERGDQVPEAEGALRRLPGVGSYVATAVRCFAFGPAALS